MTPTDMSAPQNGFSPLHHHLLGERLYRYVLARFLVVFGLIGGAYFGRDVVGIHELDVGRVIWIAVCLLVYNCLLFLLVRGRRSPEASEAGYRRLVWTMNVAIVIDYFLLTAALWIVGGAQSPFRVFYLFHLILAAVLLPLPMAYAHGAIGYLMFAGLVVLERRGWIPALHPEGAVATQGDVDGRFYLTILAAQAAMVAITLMFLTGLVRALRDGERRLQEAAQRISEFSDLQRSFLHIAIHDVKAPAHAAMAAMMNLHEGLAGPLNEKQARLVERATKRLEALDDLVRDFQIFAELDRGVLESQGKMLDPCAVVRQVVEDNRDLAELRRHTLVFDCEALPTRPVVFGVERMLRECVSNLVTNAVKYTPEGGRIVVRIPPPEADRLRIEVEDDGVGISEKDQQKLFQDFSRLRAKDAPEAEGSGLGLSIVRRIAEMHGGEAGVFSVPGEGSTFHVSLPLYAALHARPIRPEETA